MKITRYIAYAASLALPFLSARAAYAEMVDFGIGAIARIEGPVQGSGTLFKAGNKTLVLTAWHVLKSVREGEEVDIITQDGKLGSIDYLTIKRIGNVDMAIAHVNSTKSIPEILVATEPAISGTYAKALGYPSDSNGKLEISEGVIFSNSNIGIDQGYQMIYSMETRPGMSGGPIIDKYGHLIGIHGRGELDEFGSSIQDKIVKTRLNNGIPISYFVLHLQGKDATYTPQEPRSIDDLNALSYRLSRTRKDHGGEKGIEYNSLLIKLLSKLNSNDFRRVNILPLAYERRYSINLELGRYELAEADLIQAIRIAKDDELKALLKAGMPLIYERSGQKLLAIKARSELISIYPSQPSNYTSRGHSYLISNEAEKALNDFLKAVELGSNTASDYNNVAGAYEMLGDDKNATRYIDIALEIDSNHLGALRRKALILSTNPGMEQLALEIAQKAKSLSTENDEQKLQTLNLIVILNFKTNNLVGAEIALRQMKTYWPNSHLYLSSSAQYFSRKKLFKNAIKQLTKSIENNPPGYSLARLHGRRGVNWRNLQKHEEAIKDFNKAISMGEESKFIYSFRGHSFAAMGNFILACADWRKSVKMGGEYDADFVDDFCQ